MLRPLLCDEWCVWRGVSGPEVAGLRVERMSIAGPDPVLKPMPGPGQAGREILKYGNSPVGPPSVRYHLAQSGLFANKTGAFTAKFDEVSVDSNA